MLVGQALIDHDVCREVPGALAGLAPLLPAAHVRFTNLETAIKVSDDVAFAKEGDAAHGAPPAVLDCLQAMGFNLLSLSNNHSWDLGVPGILGTLEEVARRGLAHAGTGRTLAEAARPGYLDTAAGRVALVALASGGLDPRAPATADAPGVNALAVLDDERPQPADEDRILGAIRDAASRARFVIVYQHNHYWGKDNRRTPDWMQRWARRCVDAGASLYVAHGVPWLHGIEVYRGRPIFYGLGNFIFQTRRLGYWAPEAWEGVAVDLTLREGALERLRARPLLLNEQGERGPRFVATRGVPRPAGAAAGRRILERLAAASQPYGTVLRVEDEVAELVLAGSTPPRP